MSDNYSDLKTINFEEHTDSLCIPNAFTNISCIQLEMTDECIIGKTIRNIIDTKDKLIVFADNEIFIFNRKDGKFLNKIGSIGEGPDEYLSLADICFNPDNQSIIAFDRYKHEFIEYDMRGVIISRKHENCIGEMWSMERALDGTILSNNLISSGNNPSNYAFTLLQSNNLFQNLDPFSPIYVEDSMASWAERPMSVLGNDFKFIKMLSDTIFTIKNEDIRPLYKLNFNIKMASKESVALLGEFPGFPRTYTSMCREKGELPGIDKIFETNNYIILVPNNSTFFGIYWIDKKKYSGFHISATANANNEFIKLVKGKTIKNIIASNEKEFICCFDAMSGTDLFKLSYEEAKDECVFPQEVISSIEKFDPEGNPFLIFYEH